MSRHRLDFPLAAAAGLLLGLVLWATALGVHLRRHEPGLWTLRFNQVIECGLDYNGPPFVAQRVLWLTCGEADGWQLWPWW